MSGKCSCGAGMKELTRWTWSDGVEQSEQLCIHEKGTSSSLKPVTQNCNIDVYTNFYSDTFYLHPECGSNPRVLSCPSCCYQLLMSPVATFWVVSPNPSSSQIRRCSNILNDAFVICKGITIHTLSCYLVTWSC